MTNKHTHHSTEYTLRISSKASKMGLRILPWYHLEVVVPHKLQKLYTADTIEQFLTHHQSRIERHMKHKTDSILAGHPDLSDHSREHFETHRESALQFITQKVEQRNSSQWRNYQKITVKSLRSKRWSCSSRWNLNFNYKLIFLPSEMADYIVVHELCHLQEMNHGPKFWRLVEHVYWSDWKKRRKIR